MFGHYRAGLWKGKGVVHSSANAGDTGWIFFRKENHRVETMRDEQVELSP